MHHLRLQAANLLTGLRLAMTPVFIALAWDARAAGWGAGLLFVVIAASDVWDGRLARRYGSAGRVGRIFDHVADITFILGASSMYALQSLVPWWVPAAIGGSFAFYVIDSWLLSAAAPALIASRVGHVAGICNYALIGVLAFNNITEIHLLSAAFLGKLFLLVPLYSAAAVITRLAARRPVASMEAT
jgi:CDP-diacylglycerol--glycerol-3-phosphate 3-phosphatidyltransferase